MNSKDYKLIARAFKVYADKDNQEEIIKSTTDRARQDRLISIACTLAHLLQDENECFDGHQFLKECGL